MSEALVGKVIVSIRKNKKRACYQNILNLMNRNDPNLEMEQLKEIIMGMEEKNLVINKGKSDAESFFIMQEDLDASIEIKEDKQHENGESLKSLTSFIDGKLYEVILNNIKTEVKNVVYSELNMLKEANELSIIKIPEQSENTNDVFIKSLNEEIAFLRKELQSKDEIIKKMLDERQIKTKVTFNKDNCDAFAVDNSKLFYADKNNNVQNDDSEYTEVSRKKAARNKRSVTVIGDSIIKGIEAHKMKRCMNHNERIYVKSFSGAVIDDLRDYAKPSQRYDPDLFILHGGSNELRSVKTPEEISDEVVKLALELKTDKNEVMVSGLVGRSDEHNEKGMKVNDFLKIKCSKYNLCFINNSNISVNKHLNGSGLHLNQTGTNALAKNFLRVINI